jgi:hypothetical protein
LAYAQGPIARIENHGLLQNDLAVLEDTHPHSEIRCMLNVTPPALGFDLKLHTGYDVSIPFRDLADSSPTTLAIVFRVTPESAPAALVVLSQHFQVPAIAGQTEGDAQLGGSFDVGLGRYRVDWLLRDSRGRVCSSHWILNARLSGKDREVTPAIGPGVVEPVPAEVFGDEPQPRSGPLRVNILVNFAPGEDELAVPADEKNAIVAILRNMAREPRIGRFSLVAFNLRDQQLLFRQSGSPRIDFARLGEALRARPAGTIDVNRLALKHGPAEFLNSLIAGEAAGNETADALIIASPKTVFDQDLSAESLRLLRSLPYPVFYLVYNTNPYQAFWSDIIGKAVRFVKGREYAIAHPRDVWFAWQDIMSRLSDRESALAAAAR